MFVALATFTGYQQLAVAQETCFDVGVTYVDTGGWGRLDPFGVLRWSSGVATLEESSGARITTWSGSLSGQAETSIAIEIWDKDLIGRDDLVHAFSASLTEGTTTETNEYGTTTFVATVNQEGCATTNTLVAEIVVPGAVCEHCAPICEHVITGGCGTPHLACTASLVGRIPVLGRWGCSFVAWIMNGLCEWGTGSMDVCIPACNTMLGCQ